MILRPSRHFLTCSTIGFCALGVTVICGLAAAESPRISQTRINEYAAALLRAHRVLIEDPGLRRPGEQLSPYMHRIAAPLPNESQADYLLRTEGYVASVERLLDRRALCITAPPLNDNTAQNTAIWRKATAAAAALPGRVERLRAAWTLLKRAADRQKASDRLAVEFDYTLIAIKTAFEALRDARP
jgi:hypothetical protein